jgi:SAM-dependent methyltransferase
MLVSSLKAVVPRRPWRILRNLAASRGIVARTSGSHDTLSPAELVEGRFAQFRGYLDMGLRPSDLEGRDVLELGPGNNLSVAILCLAAGARRVVCIDRFRSRPNVVQVERAYQLLHARLSEIERERCRDVFDGVRPDAPADPDGRLAYLWDCGIEGAEKRLGIGRFDLIISTAVLEHVASVEAAIRSMSKLLRPGGRIIHRVDLRSHEDEESHPLEFLTHSVFVWRLMTSHTGEPNRQRASEYCRLLEKYGFALSRLEVTRSVGRDEVEAIRPRLARPFRDLPGDDLMRLGIFFDARKDLT